jgi:hypothetical protein
MVTNILSTANIFESASASVERFLIGNEQLPHYILEYFRANAICDSMAVFIIAARHTLHAPPRPRIPYWKVLGAIPKREPVGNNNSVALDSLKMLDPNRR